jgi:putative membrane protein
MPELDELPPLLPQAPLKPTLPPAPGPLPFQRAEPTRFEPRPGDLDEGEARLPQAPVTLDEPKSGESARELTPLDEELRRATELMASEPTVFGLPSLFGHPLVGLVMLAAGGLLGLFVFNQVASAVNAIKALPEGFQWAGWGFFGLLTFAVLYSIVRLTILYIRLRRNKQLRLRGLIELEKRTHLRWLINAKRHEAYTQLEGYLREYPLETAKERKRLTAVGVTGDDLYALSKAREKLLDRDRWADADAWFDGFRDTFQAKLDEAAARRVSYWARRTAFATAVVPNALADTGLTLYFSFALLADLCTIYNLRAGRLGTMVLLSRVFFNSYLAGQFNEMEGWTSDQIQQLVEPHLPTSELVLGKVFSKLGAKASAGAVNYLLLSRLGKYGCRMLRPVTRDV